MAWLYCFDNFNLSIFDGNGIQHDEYKVHVISFTGCVENSTIYENHKATIKNPMWNGSYLNEFIILLFYLVWFFHGNSKSHTAINLKYKLPPSKGISMQEYKWLCRWLKIKFRSHQISILGYAIFFLLQSCVYLLYCWRKTFEMFEKGKMVNNNNIGKWCDKGQWIELNTINGRM